MKRLLVTTWIGAAGLFTLLLVPLQGCTNLDEVPSSTITPGTFFGNEGEVLAGLAGVYAQLRGAFPGYCCAYYVLSEISTDELVVPTRGQDWYDNGRWLEIHRQTWTANSPSGLQDINSAWVNDFTGIADANVVLAALENRTRRIRLRARRWDRPRLDDPDRWRAGHRQVHAPAAGGSPASTKRTSRVVCVR